ncbi:unnamed protein product [Brugia pahangi]|uniref:Uncharacterized protein n=1 Tax=Brugia pahangi TaxID=6280 RepID=A0A0N4T562_BRUPA|nr:unnamed protein product [Brugia pahangi]
MQTTNLQTIAKEANDVDIRSEQRRALGDISGVTSHYGSHRVDELRDDCVRAGLGRAREKCLGGRLPKLSIKRREFRRRGIQRVEHNILAINDDVRAKTKLRHSTAIQGSRSKREENNSQLDQFY